ncbi:hypothetical protein ABB37_00827 [Leptomonas pyrrhocoris]|uniref:Uncharacterized protein n=1 Tax=Leptomonas pyrrhocoris TaxID=157538 RepID=A0A0M9GB58_LEPPY|nr:hypothetical protein ABB37_00827 [Leptomonas pyrrhocoris]XP_015665189.1 hypothetical protein ABB37_00827 [Leptomonas pyrrhocoris]KPA86749.1 hypothetical protein ABB37_00827 [Leptomonas pyrrhocoris]KPA86750.1 hypothetical protein ABB37_00827 [Leptomonas pyrrhocoris]|eukprot:XP_015665188.1 hypothetical protein ABB37_00827 [Leptomonas pyrrhocoris]
MGDFLSQHQVQRDYYRESRQGAVVAMDCPYCKRRGRFAANAYELAKRIPTIMTQGIALCHGCQDVVLSTAELVTQKRAWYCEYCEICLCPTCQKARRKSS